MNTSCNFGSIRQIHARLVSEGYSISEYFLRQLVKENRVAAVYSGTKAYLRYDNVLAALNGDETNKPA